MPAKKILRDATVTGATAFTGPVTLSGDPTSALHAATKQYVDAAGVEGSEWHYGTTVPAAGLGREGDFYLRSNGQTYEKTGASTWTARANITGPQGIQGVKGDKGDTGDIGPQGPIGLTGDTGLKGDKGDKGDTGAPGTPGEQWHYGTTTVPAEALGAVGDFYLHSSGLVWEKTAVSTWTLRMSLTGPKGDKGDTGAPGAPGEQWHYGTTVPAGATGAIGDFYLRSNGDVYEKTGASTWTLRTNLTGPAGSDASVTYGTPVALNPDVANTAGTSTSVARSDHIHNVSAAPAVGLSFTTTNSEGTATDFSRADHTHAITAFDATAPVSLTPDTAAAVGTATTAARRDHRHLVPAAAPATSLSSTTTNAEGNAASFARSNHTHAVTFFDTTPPNELLYDNGSSVGTAPVAARRDHTHDLQAPVTTQLISLPGPAANYDITNVNFQTPGPSSFSYVSLPSWAHRMIVTMTISGWYAVTADIGINFAILFNAVAESPERAVISAPVGLRQTVVLSSEFTDTVPGPWSVEVLARRSSGIGALRFDSQVRFQFLISFLP